jgi:hypothetical protein
LDIHIVIATFCFCERLMFAAARACVDARLLTSSSSEVPHASLPPRPLPPRPVPSAWDVVSASIPLEPRVLGKRALDRVSRLQTEPTFAPFCEIVIPICPRKGALEVHTLLILPARPISWSFVRCVALSFISVVVAECLYLLR